jgi:hypothetical protein
VSGAAAGDQLGACARDQLRGALGGCHLRERGPDRSAAGPIGKRVSDLVQALTRIAQGHVGHRAHKLVGADPDDQIEGTQMLLDERHDLSEQQVACHVTRARRDDVHIHEDQATSHLAAAIQLPIELGQARDSGTCSRRRVGPDDRKLTREGLTIYERTQPLTSTLLPIARSLLTILGSERTLLSGRRTLLRRPPTLLGRTSVDLGTDDPAHVRILLEGDIALRDSQAACLGSMISRPCRPIAQLRDLVPPLGSIQPQQRCLTATGT